MEDTQIRDYFAAAALTGLLAGDRGNGTGSGGECGPIFGNTLNRSASRYAAFAYELADAMLAARERKPAAKCDSRGQPTE